MSLLDTSALTPLDLAVAKARNSWLRTARPNQLPPAGDWDTLMWLAGRFFGKSRSLYEVGWWEPCRVPGIRVHALAPTIGDVRRVTFEGESGLLARTPPELIKQYKSGDHELHFTNGSSIYGFSLTEEADRLRGPQCHMIIADEIAAADRPAGNLESAYKVATLGCRLRYPDGTPSRKYIATTPRPIPFLRNLINRPGVRVIRGTSYENLPNVAASIQNELMAIEGTAYARQELHGEFLEENELAIFKRAWFRLWPAGRKLPQFSFVLMAIDSAFEEEDFNVKKQSADFSACGIYGIFNVAQCFSEDERKKLGVRGKYAALLCDFWMERLGFPDLLEKVRQEYRTKWGSPGRRADVVLIEDKGSGISLRQSLGRYGVPCFPYNPGRDSKLMRAHAASPFVLQGCMFVPESSRPDRKGLPRDWVEPMLEQVCAYSGKGSVEHDDAVDVLSSAIGYFGNAGMLETKPQERQLPDPDEVEERNQREAMKIRDAQKRRTKSAYGV